MSLDFHFSYREFESDLPNSETGGSIILGQAGHEASGTCISRAYSFDVLDRRTAQITHEHVKICEKIWLVPLETQKRVSEFRPINVV